MRTAAHRNRNSHIAAAACLLSLPLFVGCIGVTAKPPPGAPTPILRCMEPPVEAKDGLLDDFEDGDTALANVAGRAGYWYKAADSGGSYFGPDDIGPYPGTSHDGSFAAHPVGRTATGGAEVWGAQFGVTLNQGEQGYDASQYVGISFWAKAAEGTAGKVRFDLADVNTHPDGGVCKDCWNHFGRDMELTYEWREYTILFRNLSQEPGWGDPRPAHVDVAQLFALVFKIRPGNEFDFWVDDVKFVTCRDEE